MPPSRNSLPPTSLPRAHYAEMFGPTKGDRLRLADTELVIEVEKDFTTYGEEVKFGGGKVIRDGMGQAQTTRARGAVDTVITNAVILDHWGIVKADVGLKDGLIHSIGKAGNPDIQPGVTIIVGPGTEVIAGEGKILTAGGFDSRHDGSAITPAGADIPGDVATVENGCVEREVNPVRNDGAQVIQPGSIAGGRRNLRILVDVLGFAMPVGAAQYQPGHPWAFERLECSVRADLQFIVGHQLEAVVGVLGLKCKRHAAAEGRSAERDLPVIGVWLDAGCAIGGPNLPVPEPGLLVGHELRRTEINSPAREGGGFIGGPECAAVIGAHTAGNTEEVPPINGLVD